MKFGELLIAARLITVEKLEEALLRQDQHGGRIGDNLVAVGAADRETLEDFLYTRIPHEPQSLAETGIDLGFLIELMLKLFFSARLETEAQLKDAIKLPSHLVTELINIAMERHLIQSLGQRASIVAYTLTEDGKARAQQALKACSYAGPAPITLDSYVKLVKAQKVNLGAINFQRIRDAFHGLTALDSFVEKVGPALNSNRAILLYGPPGNGKTSFAQRFALLFGDLIHVPYAVLVGGQIIKVFDAHVHTQLTNPEIKMVEKPSLFKTEQNDLRWVPCKRPFVTVGGELTLEMLDLQYDPTSAVYEAPMHIKALGGCFMIDDFGRQLISPSALLNRWIVPMESRVDYLKLHTGKSFGVPFEELLIFSTNIEPESLMDPAFLRRLPYKILVGAPDLGSYREIFDVEATAQGLELTDEIFATIVRKITEEKQLDLAAYQPKFIVDQVVAACKFVMHEPRFEQRFIDYAIDNLRVHRQHEAA